ncbi:MAG: sulfatase-like hydrolase/transferase [Prevotella sp.]|nr:sulfatase-like hydrolase/transferase [Prevotella sp.]
MHGPYDKCVEHGFTLRDKSLPEQYKNYLVNCHYMDKQIEGYINELKKKGVYDNSVIVIASDHDAHPWALGMEGKLSTNLPLYIINGGVDKTEAWQGECNQVDVYTTLADILGIQEWRGLGHTLLRKGYKNSVTDKTFEISELIIRSNYFKNYRNN